MRFLGGRPLLDYLAVLIKDLDRRAFDLFAIGNVGLAHADLRLGILNKKHTVFHHGTARRYLAGFIDRKGCIRGNRITFRSNCFAKDICLAHGELAAEIVGLTLLRSPAVNQILAVRCLFKNLDNSAIQFFTTDNIYLIYNNMKCIVFNKVNFVASLILGRLNIGSNLAVLSYRDIDIGRYFTITNRCIGLAKDIVLASLQLIAEVMRLALLRYPAVYQGLAAVFTYRKDLQLSPLDLFAVAGVDLIHVEADRIIINEIDFLTGLLINRRLNIGSNRSVFSNFDRDSRRYLSITGRGIGLAKDILLACLQLIAEVMCLALLRYPAVYQRLAAVFTYRKDFQLSSFDLFAVAGIDLIHVEVDRVVLDEIDRAAALVLCAQLLSLNRAVRIDRDLNIRCHPAVSGRCHSLAKDIGFTRFKHVAEVMCLTFLRSPTVEHLLAVRGLLEHLKHSTGNFLTAACFCLINCEVNLPGILEQYNTVLGNLTAGGNLTVRADRKGYIGRHLIAFRSDCLTKDIGLAGLKTFYDMGFICRFPGCLNVTLAVNYLKSRTRHFLAVIDVDLADGDRGLLIRYDNDHIAAAVSGGGALCYNLTLGIQRENSIRSHQIAVRSRCLTKGVGLVDIENTLENLNFTCGIPLGNDLAILIQDLQVGTRQLLIIRDIRLADANHSLSVFDKKHAVAHAGGGACDIALFIQHKGGFRTDGITLRGNGFLQCIGNTRCQAFYLMGLRGGIPLLDHLAVS